MISPFNYTCFKSAFGWVSVAGSDRGIARVTFGAATEGTAIDWLFDGTETSRNAARSALDSELSSAADLLRRYFNGEPVDFALDVNLEVGTAFQKNTWQVAARIPYGEIRSYGWIAEEIGKPKAARAVGRAMGANLLPIIVPCHRVLRSNGGLGGYSGGLQWKERLLALERTQND